MARGIQVSRQQHAVVGAVKQPLRLHVGAAQEPARPAPGQTMLRRPKYLNTNMQAGVRVEWMQRVDTNAGQTPTSDIPFDPSMKLQRKGCAAAHHRQAAALCHHTVPAHTHGSRQGLVVLTGAQPSRCSSTATTPLSSRLPSLSMPDPS